jgi:1,4-dihydroxy-2-naphthoate octaprenyltransferase
VYVESLRITPLAILFGCSMGFLASAILVLNNLRDMETDAAAGKRTLATLIGRQRTRYLLAVLTAAAFVIPIVVFMSHLAPVTVMAVHFAIPVAAVPVRTAFATTSPPALVAALKRMAVAELAFALLLTVGLII